MNPRGAKTKERRFTNRRRKQGGLESALPWVLSLAALALFIPIAVDGNPLTDSSPLQKVKFVMKAGRPVDRNTL
jgi:hypothetical protein